MLSLTIKTPSRQYPIYIGKNIDIAAMVLSHLKSNQLMLVFDDNTDKRFKHEFVTAFTQADKQVKSVTIKSEESNKNWDNVRTIIDALVANNFDRNAALIAIGGGIVGDITGFAAACYMRGIQFVQIPTTLLAQVDSSVGGKTGINHESGKNLIGAFYQPELVVIDTKFLSTLPSNQVSAGFAEIIKYGLIASTEFYHWQIANSEPLMQLDSVLIEQAIYRSCAIKAQIVAADEKEQGNRAILNYGHTFGHVIEAATEFNQYLHGEAVAIGMLIAMQFSQQFLDNCQITAKDIAVLKKLLEKFQLPTTISASITMEQWQRHLSVDKKVSNGQKRFILLEAIAKPKIVTLNSQSNQFKQQLQQWI